MPGLHTNTGAKRAREAREELGLADGQPLDCILTTIEETFAVPVVLAALPDGLAGCCVQRPDGRALLFANGSDAAVRCRFTLAHELGHVRCGHDASVAVDTYETLAGQTHDPNEVQANAFAAEFLAPARGIQERIQGEGEPTLEHVVALAAEYGISTIAALYRLNTLGLTTRGETLKQEIEDGEAEAVWDRLDPEPVYDVVAGLAGHLPRLSPQIERSALDSLISGLADLDAVSASAGVAAERMAGGAGLIGA